MIQDAVRQALVAVLVIVGPRPLLKNDDPYVCGISPPRRADACVGLAAGAMTSQNPPRDS